MPIKVFAAPGDTRDDFANIEVQVNRWIDEAHPRIISITTTVNDMPGKRDHGMFMMTLVVLHDEPPR